jgi:hypothetical protein
MADQRSQLVDDRLFQLKAAKKLEKTQVKIEMTVESNGEPPYSLFDDTAARNAQLVTLVCRQSEVHQWRPIPIVGDA